MMDAWPDLDGDIIELVPWPAATPVAPLAELAFRKNAWLPHELATLRNRFAADEAISDIAAALRRPLHGVASKLWELGLRRNSKRPWGDFEDAVLTAEYGLVATASLALGLGRGVTAIYARAQLLGLSDANPAWEPWEDAQLRAGYARGVPLVQLAALIGRPLSGLSSRASLLGLKHPSHPCDWSNEEATRALELAATGMRYVAIIEQLSAEGHPRRSKAGFGSHVRKLGYGRGWGRRWTVEEDALLSHAYASGTSLTPLTARLSRTRCSVRWRAQSLGLQGAHPQRDGFRGGPVWSDSDLAVLRAEYGITPTRTLAAKLGRKLAAVYTRANVLGLRHPFMRDFTSEDDAAIAAAWHDGTPLAELARSQGRDIAVLSKHAIRIGLAFNDPARPVRPDRRRKPAGAQPRGGGLPGCAND